MSLSLKTPLEFPTATLINLRFINILTAIAAIIEYRKDAKTATSLLPQYIGGTH
jgi:hypothetical protein